MTSGSCHMVGKHFKGFVVLFFAAFGSISASGCRVDFSPGDPFCSNGVKEEGEMCDGNDLGGKTCVTQGYDSGVLACNDDCSGLDVSGCYEKPPIEWIHVSGGSFFMGSSDRDLDERPVHLVNIPSFEMMKTEVTVEFYSTCVIAGACEAPGTGVNCNWGRSGFEDHPLNCVTWFQAMDFCNWVAGRLPSEAEWEYAARSNGQDIVYPWGNQTATCDYAVMNDVGVGCGTESTWPVCSKPNGNTTTGLCDMAGNVWEWVLDWYHQNYEGAPSDGSAWLDPEGTQRVFRGGGIWSAHDRVRAAKRHRHGPSVQIVDLGFRCAR